eukprot:GHVU01103222.1.p1 GENE.GHVU01103222.1~~GHVU01103222.1.p1  ORF type:complete len:179 (+),score=12.65 GHVU01103222.1:367-903(+)
MNECLVSQAADRPTCVSHRKTYTRVRTRYIQYVFTCEQEERVAHEPNVAKVQRDCDEFVQVEAEQTRVGIIEQTHIRGHIREYREENEKGEKTEASRRKRMARGGQEEEEKERGKSGTGSLSARQWSRGDGETAHGAARGKLLRDSTDPQVGRAAWRGGEKQGGKNPHPNRTPWAHGR